MLDLKNCRTQTSVMAVLYLNYVKFEFKRVFNVRKINHYQVKICMLLFEYLTNVNFLLKQFLVQVSKDTDCFVCILPEFLFCHMVYSVIKKLFWLSNIYRKDGFLVYKMVYVYISGDAKENKIPLTGVFKWFFLSYFTIFFSSAAFENTCQWHLNFLRISWI